MGKTIVRALCMIGGVICAALGVIGAFLPVLPTTPFLLLAGFLFARSSKRLDAWLKSTKVWKAYVEPFVKKQYIPAKTKARILVVSGIVMGISAYAVRNLSVNVVIWAILALVMLWLLYLMFLRIPTTGSAVQKAEPAALAIEEGCTPEG